MLKFLSQHRCRKNAGMLLLESVRLYTFCQPWFIPHFPPRAPSRNDAPLASSGLESGDRSICSRGSSFGLGSNQSAVFIEFTAKDTNPSFAIDWGSSHRRDGLKSLTRRISTYGFSCLHAAASSFRRVSCGGRWWQQFVFNFLGRNLLVCYNYLTCHLLPPLHHMASKVSPITVFEGGGGQSDHGR
jgi:hypothetical protein